MMAGESSISKASADVTPFDPLRGPTPAGTAIPRVIDRPDHDFWVFGYGSLIWNPGFDTVESRAVRLHGYHRRFCVRSVVYRGTPADPGLVMGLRPGGQVAGVAHRVRAADADAVLTYLEDRELRHEGYLPRWLKLHPTGDDSRSGGDVIEALTFVVPNGSHSLVELSDEAIAGVLARCSGENGSNADYLFNLNAGLKAVGVNPGQLVALERRVRALMDDG